MKLLFIEENGRLSKGFKENTNYEIQHQENLHLLSMCEADILIVDSQKISHKELLERKEYFADFKDVFFVTNETDITPILMINNIKPIVTENPNAVLQTIEQYIYSDSLEKKVFVFMATDRKAGLTTISHAVAENLASTIEQKVLLINLSDNPNEMIQGASGFEQLKNSLKLNTLSIEELRNFASPVNNYFYIGASNEVLQERKYDIESANNLYRLLKNQSEYVVLLDVGANPNSPFYLVALDYFKNTLLVTKPNTSYQRVFEKVMNQVLSEYYKLNYDNFLTIVNGTYDYQDSLDKYNVLTRINYSQVGNEAENKNIPLHKLDVFFNEEIQTISKYIAYKVGYKPQVDDKKKSWLSKFKKNKVGEKV